MRATTALALFEHPEYTAVPSEPACDIHARIASVAPAIIGAARRCSRSLSPRQRARLDVLDLVQEGWLALLRDDHQYDRMNYPQERGGYLGFARLKLRQHFARVITSRAYTMPVPRPDGDRRERSRRNPEYARAVDRATRDAAPINPRSAVHNGNPVVEDVERREDAAIAREAVRRAVGSLQDKRHATILGRAWGILGATAGPRPGTVTKARMQAEAALRDILAAEPVSS
jgi:hypothetical protein